MLCKCCRKEHADEYAGHVVEGNGVLAMGYGSRYDGNKYKFTLVSGWYCWRCLDKEIAEGLCQPLVVYYRSRDGSLDDLRVKRYRVRSLEHEANED